MTLAAQTMEMKTIVAEGKVFKTDVPQTWSTNQAGKRGLVSIVAFDTNDQESHWIRVTSVGKMYDLRPFTRMLRNSVKDYNDVQIIEEGEIIINGRKTLYFEATCLWDSKRESFTNTPKSEYGEPYMKKAWIRIHALKDKGIY